MNFFYRLTAGLIAAAAIAMQPVVMLGQSTSQEVCRRAKQFTVLINGNNGNGSGVIYKKEGNTYFVITNHHVVEDSGSYKITTPDGQRHPVESPRSAVGFDLAELEFKSDRSYEIAQLGNFQTMTEGATVYATGFPGNQAGEKPSYSCTRGQIDSRRPNGTDGYTMVYSNQTIPGMSGGPVLDELGSLVGINGRAIPIAKGGVSLGALRLWIPIDTFLTARNWQPIAPQASNPGTIPPQQRPPISPPVSNPGTIPPQQRPPISPPASNPGTIPPQPRPPRRKIDTGGGLHPGSVERQHPGLPNLTPEQVNKIIDYLNYHSRISVPCNTPGAIREHEIQGVPGYTVCFRSAIN